MFLNSGQVQRISLDELGVVQIAQQLNVDVEAVERAAQ
jgi:hypothetical protein